MIHWSLSRPWKTPPGSCLCTFVILQHNPWMFLPPLSAGKSLHFMCKMYLGKSSISMVLPSGAEHLFSKNVAFFIYLWKIGTTWKIRNWQIVTKKIMSVTLTKFIYLFLIINKKPSWKIHKELTERVLWKIDWIDKVFYVNTVY